MPTLLGPPRLHNVLTAAMVWAFCLPGSASQIEAAPDLDLGGRIVLTIAATANPDVDFTADDLDALQERGDIYIDEDQGLYLYTYPLETRGFEGSGYYRIASPTQFKKPKTEEGWDLLDETVPGGATIWFREVSRSGAEPYNEVQASAKKGKLVLTTSMRRPPNEPREQAEAAIAKDFQLFLEMGKKYGIISRLVIEQLQASDPERQQLDDGALINVLGQGQQENRVSFRLYALDNDGGVDRNVDYFSIKIGGMLAPHAKVEGATYNTEKAQFEIHGAADARFVLVFPGMETPGFAEALAAYAERDGGDGGFTLDIEANYEAERQPT